MKNSDLVTTIQKKYSYLSVNEVKVILEETFNFIKEQLKNNKKIEIRNFGVFESKLYKAKKSFNPKTLEYKDVEERFVPSYRASITLKKNINKVK